MKLFKILIAVMLYFTISSFNLSDFFSERYIQAVEIYNYNRYSLRNQCAEVEKYQVCSSIVFPEFIRYSEFKDFLETEALKTGYVLMGSEKVDFSIGHCQMKPSFIEKLEGFILNSKLLQEDHGDILKYKNTSAKEIRKERVERLENIEWQFRYLSCFYDIMQELTREFAWNSVEDKIRYYSTAYNYNFLAPREEIVGMYSKKWFPYGHNYNGNQHAYHEIAIQFYKLNIKN